MNKNQPEIFIITGSESTGKSTLAENLAHHFDTIVIPEYSRNYITALNRPYNYRDVEVIAQKQIGQYNNLLHSDKKIIFVDTWLIITKVWFEVVYNKFPNTLVNEIRNAKINSFLLCDTDIPWKPDDVRENGGDKRLMLHDEYIKNLELFSKKYCIISGNGKKRLENAITFVEQQLI